MIEKGDHSRSLQKIAGKLFEANMAHVTSPEDKCVQGTPNCSFS
jgi:hypothetical protein